MKLTMDWLKEKRACEAGKSWFVENKQEGDDSVDVLRELIQQNQLQWANWTIVHVMNRKQYLAYAIYAAEQVIDIYEKKYPDKKKPREAINAARKVLENDSEENRKAAAAAASDAYAAAAYAAYAAAADAAYAAACAAKKQEESRQIEALIYLIEGL